MLAIHPFQYAPAHSNLFQPTVSDSWLQHNRRVLSTNNPDDIGGGWGGIRSSTNGCSMSWTMTSMGRMTKMKSHRKLRRSNYQLRT